MDLGLRGKTVVITGSSKGIGFSIAKGFLSEGANVVICARDKEEIKRAAKELENLNYSGKILAIQADMTDETDVYRLANQTLNHFGIVDCWVNNVGASFGKEGKEYDSAQINRIVSVCFSSVVFGSQAAFRCMKDKGGCIVNISSLAARCPTVGASTLYGPLKAAVAKLAVTFAGEYAAYHIRVNAVLPGFTATPAVAATIDPKYLQRNADETLLRRVATPEEIAAPVIFLCSNKASYITGATLEVSGGRGIVLNPEYSYNNR